MALQMNFIAYTHINNPLLESGYFKGCKLKIHLQVRSCHLTNTALRGYLAGHEYTLTSAPHYFVRNPANKKASCSKEYKIQPVIPGCTESSLSHSYHCCSTSTLLTVLRQPGSRRDGPEWVNQLYLGPGAIRHNFMTLSFQQAGSTKPGL